MIDRGWIPSNIITKKKIVKWATKKIYWSQQCVSQQRAVQPYPVIPVYVPRVWEGLFSA